MNYETDSYNNITGNEWGVVIDVDGEDATSENITINYNYIYDNTYRQVVNSQCEYLDAQYNFLNSTNFTDLSNNQVYDNLGGCDLPRYVDFCPIWDASGNVVSCPREPCNDHTDCVDDHQICLTDYNGSKYCGVSSTVNNIILTGSPLNYTNCTASSCVHDSECYDNGTTTSDYVQLTDNLADNDLVNWSCNDQYWSEDPFYDAVTTLKPTYLELLTTGSGVSKIEYILIPQLYLPNASIYFAEVDVSGLYYNSGFINQQLTVDFGDDDSVEYTSESGGLTQTASPVNIPLETFLDTYLPACDCNNCTLDSEGNCLIGVNITTTATTGKAILSNLQVGICQMKGQSCTFNQTTGEAGLCYDYESDSDYDCLKTCSVDPDCGDIDFWQCCADTSICALKSVGCPTACGTLDDDCCSGNVCYEAGTTCRCVEGSDTPQCRDSATSRYKLFNISAINETNTVYYTYENSTGQSNTCCLSADNTTCRGWLGIESS